MSSSAFNREYHDTLTPSNSSANLRIPLHSSDSMQVNPEEINSVNNHRVLVGYSEKEILPLLNFDNKCEIYQGADTAEVLKNVSDAINKENKKLIMLAKDSDIAFPRYGIYIVNTPEDIVAIPFIMNKNNEEGEWYTVPNEIVDLMVQNFKNQLENCCDPRPSVSYFTGFILALTTQIANYKLANDHIDSDWRIDLGILFTLSLGAMFYMKAAYTNNLANAKRVEFNPGTSEAQSIFVNTVAIEDFNSKTRNELLFALGTPIAALSISADVGLAIAKMSNWQLAVVGVVVKTIEDLLTNAVRASEQMRLTNPTIGKPNEIPGLGALYRSRLGQLGQKLFIATTPLLVSSTYGMAAYNTLKLFEENTALYLKILCGLTGFAFAAATVPVYSLYELGAAERSLARTGNPLSEDSYLRVFQRLGKKQSAYASNSVSQKVLYTAAHSITQGNAVGVGVTELVSSYVELPTGAKGGLLGAGLVVGTLFSVSKNKRVFEQPVSKPASSSSPRLSASIEEEKI